MEIAFFSLVVIFLAREYFHYKDVNKLLDRIQAPQATQERVTYEELSKLPTPEAPSFDSDEEFNELKHTNA